jgi:hypothetical protein
MGMEAKEWSRKHLDPRKWVELVEKVVDGGTY